MACRCKQRQSRKGRKRQHKKRGHATSKVSKTAYRHGLADAIGKWFPGQFFSRWPVMAGTQWTPQRVFWMALLLTWGVEQTLLTRFEASRQMLKLIFPKWSLGKTYTGWYEAQLKWLPQLQPHLSNRLRRQVQAMSGRHWHRRGWCAFAVDGSRVECPRTRRNQKKLGCAGRKKTGPQLFVTTLLHMGTGLPWDFRIGSGKASERRHLEEMLPNLPSRSLLVADAGFTGYDFYRRIVAAKQNFLMRVGANVHLLEDLGYVEREGPDTVYLWPEKKMDKPPVVMRLIALRQGKKKMYLVTNVQDTQALSMRDAATLYEMRWGVEVFYRSVKQTLGRRKMLSRSPEAARCELTWTMIGIWVLGLISVSKIVARGGDPLRWSVAQARDRVRQSMRLALTRQHQDRALSHELAWAVQDDYSRRRSKKARDWPHKKTETPPGNPKIQSANTAQRRAALRLKAKNTDA